MARTKIPIHVLILFLLFALVLGPLRALAGERLKRCANLLRAAPLSARIALAGVSGTSLLAGGYMVTTPVFNAINSVANRNLQTTAENGRMGAAYVREWVGLNKLTPLQGEALLNQFGGTQHSQFAILETRILQFGAMQLWSKENVAIARAAVDRIENIRWPTGTLTEENVRSELMKIPAFRDMLRGLPERVRFTADLLYEPIVTVDGQTDTYWLSVFFDRSRHPEAFSDNQLEALTDLQTSYSLHDTKLSTPVLITLVADSLTQDDLIRAKANRAADLKISGAYAYRVDDPRIRGSETYRDLNSRVVLQDELDRWALIMQNPAFAKIRSDWEAGSISDFKALAEAEDLIHSRTQVFSLSRGESLSTKAVCSILHGPAANSLFKSIRDLDVPESVQSRLAEARFSGIVSAAKTEDPDKIQQIEKLTKDRENQILAEFRSGNFTTTVDKNCGSSR